VKRAIASSDGKLYAAFCEDSVLVYIGDLTTTDTILDIKDLSARGKVTSIRWRPRSNQLYIAGSNNTDSYLIQYSVTSKKEEDLSDLIDNNVADMAFHDVENLLYLLQAPAEGQQLIVVLDFVSKKKEKFATFTAED
jgi:WD40 repeat protein